MKKIIIALLVVLSVFALVSCSSSEPTVTAQTLTLNTKDGTTDSWKTEYAYSKTGYGVWYKNAAGKYVAVAEYLGATSNWAGTPGTALTDADGKEIGKIAAKLTDIYDESTAAKAEEENYIATEFTLAVKGNTANAGAWTGEIAVAVKAVSDTQLSGIVGKYNVTFTNTVTPATPKTTLELGAVALASGGDYPEKDGVKTVCYTLTEDVKVDDCVVFEQLAGGYKYVGGMSEVELGTDGVGSFAVMKTTDPVGQAGAQNAFKFTLTDTRIDATKAVSKTGSYKQFVDYKYASKTYVLAPYAYKDGEKVIASEPVVSFSISADMPAIKTFKAAGEMTLTDIVVENRYEHVGLFVINSSGNYVDLNEYYIGDPGKEEGLAIGCAAVVESGDEGVKRELEITFKCEDAQGECDPDRVKSIGVLSETVDVKLCSYTDYKDEKTYKELATLKMYFQNYDAVKYELTSSSDGLFYVDYCLTEKDGGLENCFCYNGSDWSTYEGDYKDGVLTFTNVKIGDYYCTLTAYDDKYEGKDVETPEEGYVRFTLSLGEPDGASASKKYGTVYVKFAKTDEDAANTKLAFDCTVRPAAN